MSDDHADTPAGADIDTDGAPSGDADTSTATQGGAAQGATDRPADQAADLARRLAALEADRDKWKVQARKHEERARSNAQAATQAQTLEQQIQQLRGDLADRDVRDVERNQRLAMTRVEAKIAEAGVKPGDVADLLGLVDPLRLLANGEPDEDAIVKVAASIARGGGRPAPDADQGKGGGNLPPNMNDLIRRAAGITR